MIERWLVAIRDHPNRPPLAQCHVLTMLALRMDWKTGRGFASMRQLSADSSSNERTVRRATSWARCSGHLVQVKRGHYISGARKAATVWQLTQPGYPQAESQPDTGDLLEKPTGQNGQANRTAEQANRTAEPDYQESVFYQELSSSARAPGADAPRAEHPDPAPAAAAFGELQRRGVLPCPSCHRAPRTGHAPGCPLEGQP